MQEFRFLENDENSCLLKIEDKVWVTETDQPELVVKIGNAIAEGKAFNYDSELVLEIKEFLEANGLTIEPIPSPFTYSNNKKYLDYKDMATSSNEFIEHKGPKVAFIGGNSLEVIKKEVELINNSDTPYVAVILLEDEIIISHVVDKNTPCLSCLYERWIESHKQKFQYAQLHSDIPIIDDNFEHIYKESLLQLTTKSNKVKVINKYTLISEEHDIVAKESCKKCYGHQLNMADISLEKVITNIIDNGNRATHPRDVLKKITIGPFSPVTRIIENGDEDILNLPVFQSFIGGKPFEKSFIVHGGKGLSYYQAKMSAVGEALERYNAQVHGNEKMVFESYNSLRRHYTVLDPKRLCLDKDYPNKYDYYKKIEWVLGKNLMTNKETYLPSNAVFFVYQPNNDSLKFMPQDTTGLASGSNIEEAVYQGLCEVIERDSYAIYYRQRLKSPTIDTSTIDDINIKYLLNLLKHKNISVHLKHLKNDSGVHVIHSVTENLSKEYPIYTHGAGASLNPDIAIQRAITESI
nr:YcaO-like family protein [Paraliobacillus ryukyuensis]